MLLKSWRLAEARKLGIPAFRILTDKSLHEIAVRQPRSDAELLAITGLGLKSVEKYGQQIYRLISSVRP